MLALPGEGSGGDGEQSPRLLPLHSTVLVIRCCLDNCKGSFTACRLLRQKVGGDWGGGGRRIKKERGEKKKRSINSQFLKVVCAMGAGSCVQRSLGWGVPVPLQGRGHYLPWAGSLGAAGGPALVNNPQL